MKDPLVKKLTDFLLSRLKGEEPLLLGYSGGPDSKTLLHLLLECRARCAFQLHLAHVDHGWRESSSAEAEALREEAAGLDLPFHLLTLSKDAFREGNWEEQARDYRIEFFRELYCAHGCQALLLAHQADDQAEVVLKRVCEGAHLSRLGGLTETSLLKEMQIWRPLLSLRKKELIAWLQERGLSFIVDPTNENPRFLRGRMRTELLPLLSQGFGKEIIDNFCYLGREAGHLKAYFMKKISPYLEKVIEGEEGYTWKSRRGSSS